MIFNKTGRFLQRSLKVGHEIIYTINNYKYLEFIITPSGEINTGLKDLKDRALRAYYSLKNKMGRYFMLCPSTSLHLFDSLIKPILLYNSDFWGCHKMPANNPIDNAHMRFCKEFIIYRSNDDMLFSKGDLIALILLLSHGCHLLHSKSIVSRVQ